MRLIRTKLLVRLALVLMTGQLANPGLATPSVTPEVPEWQEISPLSREQREIITRDQLMGASRYQLDHLYQKISAGSLPNGDYKGSVPDIYQILNADSQRLDKRFLRQLLSLWDGKVFYPEQGFLMNRVGSQLRYPAKLSCGLSKSETQEPAIILDYRMAWTIPGYFFWTDWWVTGHGLNVVDEIRMVHPGLYLGQMYLSERFALYFILENPDENREENWEESCL